MQGLILSFSQSIFQGLILPILNTWRTYVDFWIPGFHFLTIFHSRARISGFFCMIFRLFVINPYLHVHNIKTHVFLVFVSSLSPFGLIFGNEKVCKLIHTKIPPTKVLSCPHAMWSIHAFGINNFDTLSTNFEKLQGGSKEITKSFIPENAPLSKNYSLFHFILFLDFSYFLLVTVYWTFIILQ